MSPTTSPGSSPCSAGERRLDGAPQTRPGARLATRWSRLGGPTASGGPRATSRAAVASPGRAGASRTSARTCWLGSRPAQPSAEARTTTGTRVLQRCPRASRLSSLACTITWPTGGPKPAVRAGSARGSVRTTRVTVAIARSAARFATTPEWVTWVRSSTPRLTAAEQTSAAPSSVRTRPPTTSRWPANAQLASPASRATAGRTMASGAVASAATQAPAADGSNRRSGRSRVGPAAITPGRAGTGRRTGHRRCPTPRAARRWTRTAHGPYASR